MQLSKKTKIKIGLGIGFLILVNIVAYLYDRDTFHYPTASEAEAAAACREWWAGDEQTRQCRPDWDSDYPGRRGTNTWMGVTGFSNCKRGGNCSVRFRQLKVERRYTF